MKNLDRRDVLKLMAGSAVLAGAAGTLSPAEAASNKDIKNTIVILGAGLAGISLGAKLRKDIPNAKIIMIDKEDTFYYQPGFTLVSSGFYDANDVTFLKEDYMPEGVEWVKNNAKAIKPEQNIIVLDNDKELKYDYLVVATGATYEWGAVDGLSADVIYDQNSNITSNYLMEGSLKTNKLMEAYSKTGGKALFTEPRSPMKCAGANKKAMFLTESRLRRAGNRDKGDISLYGGGKAVFSNKIYAETIEGIMAKKGINFEGDTNHDLIALDSKNNIATFKKYMSYTENGEKFNVTDTIEVPYDWIHLTPKHKGFQMLIDAGLSKEGDTAGWLDVHKETLQSTKFKNIFGIGDIVNVPLGKTGASCRKMYPVVAANLISQIKGEALNAKFDGYTACPLITGYGKVIMVEFNWKGTAPSLPCFGDTRESWLGWMVKLYGFRPMVMDGMLRARA